MKKHKVPTKKMYETAILMFPVIEKVKGSQDTVSVPQDIYDSCKGMVWYLKKQGFKIQLTFPINFKKYTPYGYEL